MTFTRQVNLIVWDKERKIEHFVRNASFSTDAKDLAFIAPTPSVPEFKKVDEKAFDILAHLKEDAVRKMNQPGSDDAAAGGAPSDIKIVKEEDVAGYHAVTLKASDSGALVKWLQANNYALSPGIREWVDNCQEELVSDRV